ncbi:MAG: CvpA family protein [Flavobacteriaceae bacterium]|nr:CvpA family protein [Flavobacteriaceae bacterium]
MGFIDIVLGILLLWGLFKGLKNGLFLELASLVALIAGIYGVIHFSYIAADYLSQRFDWNEHYIKTGSFIITFVVIVVAVQLAGKFLTKIADFAMLGLLNRIAGAIFGALKVAIILGAFLIFFERAATSMNLVNEQTKKESILYYPVRDIGAFVFSLVFTDKEESETMDQNL